MYSLFAKRNPLGLFETTKYFKPLSITDSDSFKIETVIDDPNTVLVLETRVHPEIFICVPLPYNVEAPFTIIVRDSFSCKTLSSETSKVFCEYTTPFKYDPLDIIELGAIRG